MRGLFNEAEVLRLNAIKELDGILKRVGTLQLQNKRPAKREEDVKLRKRAAEMLVRAIRQAYK